MSKKISVIVPVYNSGPYLKKCLDSIVNQTYSNLEIILVDDGSNDDSAKICLSYAENDKLKRVKVILKDTVGGSGTPVRSLNLALEKFTGEYVGFVDPDDWLELNMFDVLYNSLKNNYEADISVVSFFWLDESTGESSPVETRKPLFGTLSTRDMVLAPLKRDYYPGFCGYMWNKLFKASLFDNPNLRFRKDLRYGSDVFLYTDIVLSKQCKGIYTDKPLYHYLQRKTAISKSKIFDVKRDILDTYKGVEKLLNDYSYQDDTYWARGFYCHHASVFAEDAIANGDFDTLKTMQTEIKTHYDDYVKTNLDFPQKFERMKKIAQYKK
ncbi:MAG: glycosyltransferase [Oscillospiraceae bacterium]|nr:glycosyltransferase [Oscillospiraceae bacterium]